MEYIQTVWLNIDYANEIHLNVLLTNYSWRIFPPLFYKVNGNKFVNYVRGKKRCVKEFSNIEIVLIELILRNATSTFFAKKRESQAIRRI